MLSAQSENEGIHEIRHLTLSMSKRGTSLSVLTGTSILGLLLLFLIYLVLYYVVLSVIFGG